jgi:probable rRNA maturation factor
MNNHISDVLTNTSTLLDLVIDHQNTTYHGYWPSDTLISHWVELALKDHCDNPALAVVLVDSSTISEYNATYRNQPKPTNVLSFPADMATDMNFRLLGDILVCPEIINQEAETQDIEIDAHWAHIIIHGTLHLLGYDHIIDEDAKRMETEEIRILHQLGVSNPYE